MYRSFALLLLVVVTTLAGFPSDAEAYLDPGTGSYIFQMIVAGLLGAAFAVKMFWERIKIFLARMFTRNSTND